MLTTQMLSSLSRDFERDGFAHVRGFLAPAELAGVRERIEWYKQKIAPRLESYRVLFDVDGERRSVKQLSEMHKADSFFAQILRGANTTALAAALLGEDVIPHTVEYFDKAPHLGKATPAHQDGYYFCLKPNHAVTMWVALDDCDEENGCMSYVIGSHHKGIIEHQASGVVGFSQGIGDAVSAGAGLFVAAGKAGDCFAHHSMTIHLAGENRSARHRQSLGLVYYAVSANRDESAWARYQESVARQRTEYVAGATT